MTDNNLTVVSTSNQRSNLVAMKNKLADMGMSSPLVGLTALRIEIPLVAGKQTYEIDLRKSTGAGDRVLEKKLAIDHKIQVTHIGLLIQKQVPGSESNSPLYTHPDANVFATAGEAAALEAVYQGSYQFKAENAFKTPEFLTVFHRVVPFRVHQTPAASAQLLEHAQFGPSLEDKGFFELHQNLYLDGKDTNKLVFNVGSGNTAAIQANTVAVFFLYGNLYIGEETAPNSFC